MSRKGPIAGISWLQLIAGALAAMTSAWVASYLGVAGTIIGAAVGSLVASIASALYVSGLDRGTTFITESGTVVTRSERADESHEGHDVEVLSTEADSTVVVEDSGSAFSWRRVLTWTGVALGSSLLLIGGYELVTDSSFGRGDNPTITRPFSHRNTEPTPAPDQSESTRPTDDPTDGATTTPTTAAPTAAPTPTPAPEPTTAPTTAPAPAPEPTDEATTEAP